MVMSLRLILLPECAVILALLILLPTHALTIVVQKLLVQTMSSQLDMREAVVKHAQIHVLLFFVQSQDATILQERRRMLSNLSMLN